MHAQAMTVDEVFDAPIFTVLCAAYRAECLRNPDLLRASPDREAYQSLYDSGILYPIGVFLQDALIGICVVVVTSVPHFAGKRIAHTETLFVLPAYRAGGAGLVLLQAAQAVAIAQGASGLYITAPAGGRLERILPRQGFHLTNKVFYRGLA